MSLGPEDVTTALQAFGLARERMRAVVCRAVGISAADLDALEHLEAAGPLTQRELGDRLLLTSGAITMLVDRLEVAGWVRRRPHPDDRRAVLVELCDAAAQQSPEGLTAYHRRLRQIASRADSGGRVTICRFLADAADAADAAATEIGAEPVTSAKDGSGVNRGAPRRASPSGTRSEQPD